MLCYIVREFGIGRLPIFPTAESDPDLKAYVVFRQLCVVRLPNRNRAEWAISPGCSMPKTYFRQIPFHFMQILASGDDSGIINIWKLGGGGDGLIHLKKIDSHVDMAGGSSVTTLSLWNKVNQGDL